MKKSIITSLLLCACAATYSQSYYRNFGYKPVYSSLAGTSDININVGLTAFMGDLGGTRGKGEPFSKDLNGVAMRPHLGLSYGYYPVSWAKVMATFNYTTITGADSVIKTKLNQSMGRYKRNLSFRSRVQELSVSGEIYPLQLLNKSHRETLLKPFVGLGVGVFHFDPETQLNGQWIKLKPLCLEGEGFAEYPKSKPYSLYQMYIPFTLGFKYRLDDQMSLAFSTTFRKTFTDYLDDVCGDYVDPSLFDKHLPANEAVIAKQLYYRGLGATAPKPGTSRSYSKSNDSYTTLFITYSYNFGYRDKEERETRNPGRMIRVRHTKNGYR